MASSRGKLLLVEDDHAVIDLVTEVLESSGYSIRSAEGAAEAQAALSQERPDLVILDLMLPDEDGLLFLLKLTAIRLPVIICSAVDDKRERVLGLKLGAEDYVTKPFDLDELEARVEAVLRRTLTASSDPRLIRVGSLTIDHSRHQSLVAGRPLRLTPKEYGLLFALCSRAGEVIARDELARQVWGHREASRRRIIDVVVRRLRVKLAEAPQPTPSIGCVRGLGYRIAAEPVIPAGD